MIYIHQYGVTLRSITPSDIETIRNWRNTEEVRRQMLFQNVINAKQQIEWYNQLDKKRNLYFIYNEQGIIHLKGIDWMKKEGEAGIFTTKANAYVTNIAAIITLMDFAFNVLLFNLLKARVKKDSIQNIEMNIGLGYQISKIEDDCVYMTCKRDNYKIEEKIRKWLIDKSNSTCSLTFKIMSDSEWINQYINQ